jgi:CRP-like cAMP-binding protein
MTLDLTSTRLWLSSEMTEGEREVLVGAFSEVRRLEAGHTIMREGERSDSLHLLLDGWAYRYKLTRDGARQVPALLTPGDFCDLDALLFDRLDYGITTLTPCSVAVLPRDDARRIVARHPGIAAALWWLMAVENSILSEWTLCLGRRSALQHLAHLLCELLVRLSAAGRVEQNGYVLPLTQEQLADVLGLTAVHVNRTLQTLRNDGLISLQQGRLTILNWPALKALSDFRPGYLHPEGMRRLPQAA